MGGLIESLQHYPGYGKSPNNPEERPTACTTKNAKGQRSIRAGDKDKDCGMLDDPKTALGLANGPCMVKRGGKIKKNHGRGENTRTDNESGIPVPCCMHDEKWRSDQRA